MKLFHPILKELKTTLSMAVKTYLKTDKIHDSNILPSTFSFIPRVGTRDECCTFLHVTPSTIPCCMTVSMFYPSALLNNSRLISWSHSKDSSPFLPIKVLFSDVTVTSHFYLILSPQLSHTVSLLLSKLFGKVSVDSCQFQSP